MSSSSKKRRKKKKLRSKHNPGLSRRELKQKAVDLLGGCCFVCGYNKCNQSLSFHHRDPTKKEFGISRLISSLPWPVVVQELSGCLCLCLNCHQEAHQGLLDGYDLFDGYAPVDIFYEEE